MQLIEHEDIMTYILSWGHCEQTVREVADKPEGAVKLKGKIKKKKLSIIMYKSLLTRILTRLVNNDMTRLLMTTFS